MQIPFILGGGGGDSSDDCTATASDILATKTAIYNGSDDDAAYGSMADYSGTTKSATASLDGSNSRVQMAIPDEGKYDKNAKLYTTYSTMRTLIGLTDSSKFMSGTTILGLSGSITDRSGTTSSATSSLDTSNSRVRLQIPSNGYYNTSAYLYQTYSNIASLIGLTAAKIRYGETILGITGTSQGYVATTSDVYYAGSVGSVAGSMNTYSNGSVAVSSGSSCITFTVSTGNSNACYGGVSFATSINCGAYSKITLTYNVTQSYSNSLYYANRYFGFGLFSSRPTSASACNIENASYRSYVTNLTSTGTGYTMTLDISGISSNMYLGVCGANNSTGVSWIVEVTRIQLS